MKNWWLELYTIPALKSFFKAYGIVLFLTLIVSFFATGLLFLVVIGGSIYLSVAAMKNSSTCLAANMEFHKLHFSYSELRKVWIKNALIQFGVTVSSGIIFLIIASNLSKNGLGEFGLITLLPGILSLFTNYFRVVNLKQGSGALYQMIDSKKYPIKGFLATMTASTFSVFMLIFLAMFQVQFTGILVFMALIFGSSYVWFLYKAVFHQEMAKGTAKTYFRYFFKGTIPATCILMIFMAIASPLSRIPGIDNGLRHEIYSFSGPFAPDLDPLEARELLSIYQANYSFILGNTPGIETFPVSQLFSKPNSRAYIHYLDEVSNPSRANLNYILSMTLNKEKQSGSDRVAAQMAISKWPKGEKLPDYVDIQKLSNKEVPKEERLPASDEQEE